MKRHLKYHTLRNKWVALLTLLLVFVQTTGLAQSGNWTDASYRASSYASGSGSATDPYVIKTAAQLAYFAYRVTNGYDRSINVKLGDNISLSGHWWVPIGDTNGTTNVFQGTFDGDGYTISGMACNWASYVNAGLFAYIKGTGTSASYVRNLVIEDATLSCGGSFSSTRRVGMLVGGSSGTVNIENIIIRNCKINVTSSFAQNNYWVLLGGLIGWSNGSTKIANAYVDVDLDLRNITSYTNPNGIDRAWFGMVMGGAEGGSSPTMQNVFTTGKMELSRSLNYTHVGTLIGNNGASAGNGVFKGNCSYTNVPTYNGTSLSGTQFNQQGDQKTNAYISEFYKTANSYVGSRSDLSKWVLSGGKPAFGKVNIAEEYSNDNHQSKQTSYVLSGVDETQEITWTIDGTPVTPNAGNKTTITIDLKNKTRQGKVKIGSGSDAQEYNFTIAPKFYSVDLYADKYHSGSGTKADPYLITNDLELARLAYEVNNGTSTAGKYYKIASDDKGNSEIDLSSALWMPIGSWHYEGNYFNGTLDGDGHTISNARMCWQDNSGTWSSWGFFSVLKGASSSSLSTVTNLVFDNLSMEKKEGFAPVGNGTNIGAIAGELFENSELSNVIVKNSQVTDQQETYNSSCREYHVGGIIGNVSSNGGVYRIFNLSADTKVDILQNATITNPSIYIASGIGSYNGPTSSSNTGFIVPTNIYVHGPAVATKSASSVRKGGVLGYNNGKIYDTQMGTWYYVNPVSGTGTLLNKGSQEQLAAWANDFVNQNNSYIEENNIEDKSNWTYTESQGFSFGSTTLTLSRGINATVTAETVKGNSANEKYYWYTSSDKKNWKLENPDNPMNDFPLPRQVYDQYVYAVLSDNTSRSGILTVPAVRAYAVLESNGTKLTVKVTNNIWNDDTESEKNLNIQYQWYRNDQKVEGATQATFDIKGMDKDKISCYVTVDTKDAKPMSLLAKWLFYTKSVVYLCPKTVTINGTTYQAGQDKLDDKDWGYSPDKPMLTWHGAYSKLDEKGSWDDNVIVLIGLSDRYVTNGYTESGNDITWNNLGFNITDNSHTTYNVLTQDDWTTHTAGSPLFRNATITGKWNNVDYQGKIQVRGETTGLYIFGDTRFQDITFTHASDGGEYDIIYCQYNNLEMGKGVRMEGYNMTYKSDATLKGSKTTSMQIFGGMFNDGRGFVSTNRSNDISTMDGYMPNGEKGFSITLKSGHYSTVCAGGRNATPGGSTPNLNAVMGTPSMPVKCKITVDIDSTFNNDTQNNLNGSTLDVGVLLAGNHEGAMIGDVDIIVKSGKIGRIVNGSLGNVRDFSYTGEFRPPYNTYMGRANILVAPASSEYHTDGESVATTNSRVQVTEIYGGSTGRGFSAGIQVNNPFYGYSTITIKGGTFQIPVATSNDDANQLFSGIYGAGAGGMNGIGDDAHHTTEDTRIAYWAGNNDLRFGTYASAKDKFCKFHCYNDSTRTYTDVDPTLTNSKIVIEGGVFGSPQRPLDGIYAGGSGYMSPDLWPNNAIPSTVGGNIYGKAGETVASITINGGEFYCKNGIFAGGRGTDVYYQGRKSGYSGDDYPYGGKDNATPSNYTELGKIYGNVSMTINGGTFHCPVFGGGYGVADAIVWNGSNIVTLDKMARIYGKSTMTINGGTFYDNIYGGGDKAVVDYQGGEGKEPATNVTIGNLADIRASVFAGGNGRQYNTTASTDNGTIHPELVGKVLGNTSIAFFGDINQAPYIYGDIYGGGNLAQVDGNTHVSVYAANLASLINTDKTYAGQIFGGGKGKIVTKKDNTLTITSADVTGNTYVTLAKDLGNQEEGEDGKKQDNFSINVIWDKLWDSAENKFYDWENNESLFFADNKYTNPHNIYGGGNLACKVSGKATVTVLKGMTPFSLLKTQEWKESFNDNKNPHFSVFGGGYGANTTVGSTDVTINVEGDYGEYDAEVDDDTEQLSRPRGSKKARRSKAKAASQANSEDDIIPVFDNSKGIPNFTVLGVMGGGYAGLVTDSTQVVVDGKTFLHRVYGGGFGDPEATSSDDKTGEVGNNTKVYVRGANIYGDVFGGGAGVAPKKGSDGNYTYFTSVARVLGTTMVEVSDDAKIYGTVYGGGDIANVGPANYTADYKIQPKSETPINQANGEIYKDSTYKASDYQTLVNIIGGDIYGEVFAGGKGLKKAQAEKYDLVGRISGNTLLHVANTNASSFASQSFDYKGNDVPYIWNRIYGGCAFGTVDGNTLVHIEGGMIGLNIFGGGYGDLPIYDNTTDEGSGQSTDMSVLSQVLGKKDTNNEGTYANILGNTKVQIDGGSWLWNKKADKNGNITSWLSTGEKSEKVCDDLDDFKKVVYAIKNAKTFDDIAYPKAKAALNRIMNDKDTKEFFNLDKATFQQGSFRKNHNIFGGGNRACFVGTYTDANGNALNADGKPMANTGGSTVELNHSPLGTLYDEKGNGSDIFDCTSLQGLCWYLASRNTSHPQFSVFGAGYGANTKVGDAIVLAQPGAMIHSSGEQYELDGKKFRYIAQEQDRLEYTKYEGNLWLDFEKLSKEDKKLYYGSSEGSDDDASTFSRYYMSRMAWTLGIPSFTFMEIHGGGFSGYVMGDSYVEANNQMAAADIYGAGLGAKPYGTLTEKDAEGNNYDFGTVYGNSKVFIKSGNVSTNVYGGGAGVESVRVSGKEIVDKNAKAGKLVDFPEMARVKGKTQVHIYGETVSDSVFKLYRTVIVGNVYGGGDVANVGTAQTAGAKLTQDSYLSPSNYTSLVNIRGGVVLSNVFAGGNGRTAAECADYTKLGGIYGNAYLVTDRPVMTYPYCYTQTSTSDALSSRSLDPSEEKYLKHPADDVNPDLYPRIVGRMYGGCQNGTVYGNTFLALQDGDFFSNAFGGGWGNYTTTTENNVEVADSTAANVTGNTNLFVTGGRMMLTSYWLPDTRFWEPATVVGSVTYSPQYNPATRKFKINHNIYGGGNESCLVGEMGTDGKLKANTGNTYLTIKKGLLYKNTQVRSGIIPDDFFSTNEWKEVYNKVGSPHFSIFGGGYGEHTNVLGDTHIDIEMTHRGSIQHDMDIKSGEEYKHFYGGCSVMDFVGGGYSGKVTGETHINGAGGAFCRRIFGGGFYNSVEATNVDLKAIDCHDIFGGGLMGDVFKSTHINIGVKDNATSTDSPFTNADIFVHGNVYGSNDVSGYVNVTLDPAGYFADNGGDGTHINIYGGHINGNVYGAGNGDYLYALDKQGHTKVTVNENYLLNPSDPYSETEPLVYTVPMRETMPSYKAASDAAKIVNINSWRPLTNKATLNIEGSANNKVVIDGDVYGGGNSATIQRVQSNESRSTTMEGYVKLNIGNHVNIGRVFMGCNGDALFTASEDNDFMNKFQKLNGDVNDFSQELDLSDSINWITDPSNKGISTLYLSTKNSDRPTVYPQLLDLYFQPVETDIQGDLTWNGDRKGKNLTDCVIGAFCCGGNRGNMNVYPKTEIDYSSTDTDKKVGNVVDYYFPAGLTITDKIIGGCYNANYIYKGKASHEGGYLLGTAHSAYPFIKLHVECEFNPAEKDGGYVGGNVYGGCYKAGTVRGDITIDLKSDMLKGKDKGKLEKSNELLATNPEYSALNVYGAGYGMESYVYGDTHIKMAEDVACEEPTTTTTSAAGKETTTFNASGTSANYIYGGGQQGNLIGVTNVEVFNGHVFKSVTGGSYSGYVWGSTQIKVGYPRYFKVKKGQSGRYLLKRVDEINKDIDKNKTVAKETVKHSINLVADEIMSLAVWNDVEAKYDSLSGKNIPITTDADKTKYFDEVKAQSPAIGWDKIHIKIGEALYGGGYSLANGSAVMANNTTVLKYTPQYNINSAFQTSDAYREELKSLPGGTSVGFGGNTTILVADRRKGMSGDENTTEDRDHITISRQEMKEANVAKGQDLLGYYWKDKSGNYHYIYEAGKYYQGGSQDKGTLPKEMVGNDVYEYDNEGGIFGDGHLSYAQGFRTADLAGYGFASTTVSSPKIINTFQRLDVLRLTDNCFSLLGARDYATNAMDMTPYSISRVNEIQMVGQDVAKTEVGALAADDVIRARNYMGLANNILYVGALSSNVAFGDKWRDSKGLESNYEGKDTYQSVKQQYIDDYFTEGNANYNSGPVFEKRNDGTAKNMIGIASGYALKIQNVQEEVIDDKGNTKNNLYYGPVYGVIEMNLIDVREDEGGGYVYADNVHKRSAVQDGNSTGSDSQESSSNEKDHDFLEITGNFVFPYTPSQGRFIVDDCFPHTYSSLNANDIPDEKIEAHYWYVTGFNYHYNAHITGFTMEKQAPLKFNSNNTDGIVALSGLKKEQEVEIVSWKMHSGHKPMDNGNAYQCDLEERNYDSKSLDASKKSVMGGYKLYVGASKSSTYDYTENKKDSTTGFAALLNMRENATGDSCKILNRTLPQSLTSSDDARIVFQLSDSVNNSTTDYYQQHLAQSCSATLVLKAHAKQEDGKTNLRGKIALTKLFTRSGSGTLTDPYVYTEKNSGNLDANTTYYYRNGETDWYQPIEAKNNDFFYTKNKDNTDYEKVKQANVVLGDNQTYYVDLERWYTYTIDLTIEYVQGPDIDGHITITNCALPGEMIRVKKDKVEVKADQSFSVNGYYWRIGKRHLNKKTNQWEFNDPTTWSKDKEAEGYDTYHVTDAQGKGVFAGCYYDKTEDYLDIPAYYYMNGYGIQLGVTMNIQGHTDIIPVSMVEADSLVVHNYQRMDPNKRGVDLHIPEAIKRAKEALESQASTSETTYKDVFAAPRIYLSNQTDLAAFLKFMQTDPGHGANAEFVILNDLTIPDGYTGSDAIFAGIMHGNGHVIRGLGKDKWLIGENQGQIYNLGLESGSIAKRGCTSAEGSTSGSTAKGAYHCCFEYAPAVSTSGEILSGDDRTPIVYRMNGEAVTTYTQDDFRYGRVTYDLNEYYLRARYSHDILHNKEDREALKYLYDYYANGDYQYSRRKDEIMGVTTGYTYLRTGQDSDLPNYGQAETRHDRNHTIDKARAQHYVAAHKDEKTGEMVPESRTGDYLPLFDENHEEGGALINDYPFWGQLLQSTPETYPQELASQQLDHMTNRVYRTAGYYGDTRLDGYYYNAYNRLNSTTDTYVHDPAITAIDFTCQNDLTQKAEGYVNKTTQDANGGITCERGIFYPPVADNATVFHNFLVKDGVSQNLLVYTAADGTGDDTNEAYDVVHKTLAYGDATREALIKGHHIVQKTAAFATDYLHLVERTADGLNGENENCENNNFCAPIAFTVNKHAWYTRKPMYYANANEGSWEGICLPFTVSKAVASLNGEITHFYGTPSEAELSDPTYNTHTLHHEYWLRELQSVATNEGKAAATFERPMTGTTVSYEFDNTFFATAYEDRLYNKNDNPYYTKGHNYNDYLPLTANAPYIVRFPGERYYEFDLSSSFYNNILGKNEAAQTVTFHAYGEDYDGYTQKQVVNIPVSSTSDTGLNKDGYALQGIFTATPVEESKVYGMNAAGTAFSDASTIQEVMPFRTYMTLATNAGKSRQATGSRATAQSSVRRAAATQAVHAPSEIQIAEQSAGEEIRPELGVKDESEGSNDYLTVRAIGEHRVRIESSRAVNLKVYSATGQLYRILDVQPGTATYSGFYPALYIFGNVKVMVK